MLNVKVKRLGAGVAGASSLLAACGAVVGCAVDAVPAEPHHETTGSTASAVKVATADLELGYPYQLQDATSAQFLVRHPTGTDEFVRAGQSLRARIANYYLWRFLYPNDYWNTEERLDQIRVKVRVEHLLHGAPVGEPTVVETTGYQPSSSIGTKEAILAPFTVQAGSDAVKLTLLITDEGSSTAHAEVGFPVLAPIAVFGGDGTNKTVLFDSSGWSPTATPRTRVLDGGNPVASGVLNIGYTHFRADRAVNVDGIAYGETVIGKVKSYGRGGAYVGDLLGAIVHEIRAGIFLDDGAGWSEEVLLMPNAKSRVRSEVYPPVQQYPGANNGLQNAYEYALRIPESATELKVYFHVKTYLVVSYANRGDVVERKYQEGERILLREGYDNPDGSGTNFELPIDAAPEISPGLERTVIMIKSETRPGQDLFFRGGLDHDIAYSYLGFACTSSNYYCAIPIRYRNTLNGTTKSWKSGDGFLDWYGPESRQAFAAATPTAGSAGDWTTNAWSSAWGYYPRTVAVDGFGLEPLNRFGPHYWMLDVDVDCSRAYRGADGKRWFEVKSFVSNGPGWEPDVSQASSPYPSRNHVAQCGKLNVFERGSGSAWVYDL